MPSRQPKILQLRKDASIWSRARGSWHQQPLVKPMMATKEKVRGSDDACSGIRCSNSQKKMHGNVFLGLSQRWRKVSESFSIITLMHENSWKWQTAVLNKIKKLCLLDVGRHHALFISIPFAFCRRCNYLPIYLFTQLPFWALHLVTLTIYNAAKESIVVKPLSQPQRLLKKKGKIQSRSNK